MFCFVGRLDKVEAGSPDILKHLLKSGGSGMRLNAFVTRSDLVFIRVTGWISIGASGKELELAPPTISHPTRLADATTLKMYLLCLRNQNLKI